MTVETASFISQLDTALPASGDAKSEGDNHLRTIKAAVKGSFPNLGASAVTATSADLSAASGAATTGAVGFRVATQATADNSTLAASTALVTAKVTAAGLSSSLPGQSGNAGKFVTTDGTNASWARTGIIQDYQEFLTSSTWTKPADATWVYVEAIGAGGGAFLSGTLAYQSGGGGGAFNSKLMLASSLGASVSVVVGAGGLSSTTAASVSSGGNSTFGSVVTGKGGGKAGDGVGGFGGGGEIGGSGADVACGGYSSGGGASGGGLPGGSVKGGGGGSGSTSFNWPGGISIDGGNGGAPGQNGSVPGGGAGSHASTVTSGGAGRVRVWAW